MTDRFLVKFSDLPWESRFVSQLPGDPETANFTRPVRNACYSEVTPTPVARPGLVGWSAALGCELGIAAPPNISGDISGDISSDVSLDLLAGQCVLPQMRPYAARYGGHQFGHWAGQLGDGRAITLGEARVADGSLREFQLKGAGPTPYSRRADGRAVLRSSVREFLCSEAMHHLGVPTTRALSLVSTGDAVVRDMFYNGNPKAEPGAIVCRVAPTFLRFGNFEILTASGEYDLLKRLTEDLIATHFPEISVDSPDATGALLDTIAERTAHMVAHWMRVGFVHGVMNTDNMSVLGLTIDYGPYGWLEGYEPGWTPNTTDAQGRRYCFGQQPQVALWNLACMGEALLPLIQGEQRVQASIAKYRSTFQAIYQGMLAAKLGLATLSGAEDEVLVQDLFALLQAAETDHTIFFRRLCDWPGLSAWDLGEESAKNLFSSHFASAFYAPEVLLQRDVIVPWLTWMRRYALRVKQGEAVVGEGIGTPFEASAEARIHAMKQVNPKYVLRNYLAQEAIQAAEQGDSSVLARLARVLQNPYEEQPAEEDLAQKRPEWARNAPGCSALSCSS